MKVCILGSGLTSLTLAKTLVNQGITVEIFPNKEIKSSNKLVTLGISKKNIEFFNKNILNVTKLLWDVNKIEVYSENLKKEKILNFEDNKKKLFSMIKNYQLKNLLLKKLNKSKLFKIKKNFNYIDIMKNNYKLVFNCDYSHHITKKIFYKKIDKNYKSCAYTTIVNHKKLANNNIASQIFTKIGPIAFLPISSTETSVVYSVKGKKKINLKKLIKKYNTKYQITKINNISSFQLKLTNLRSYYYKNIIAFGDLLHRLHPLAGQGFNMTIRDIKVILELIKFKIDHGMDLDNSIFLDFEKNVKHKNYLFSNSIDFIYEFFNLESKTNNNILSKSIKFIGKNKFANKLFKKFADNGIEI